MQLACVCDAFLLCMRGCVWSCVAAARATAPCPSCQRQASRAEPVLHAALWPCMLRSGPAIEHALVRCFTARAPAAPAAASPLSSPWPAPEGRAEQQVERCLYNTFEAVPKQRLPGTSPHAAAPPDAFRSSPAPLQRRRPAGYGCSSPPSAPPAAPRPAQRPAGWWPPQTRPGAWCLRAGRGSSCSRSRSREAQARGARWPGRRCRGSVC